MELSERKKQILRAVVENYIQTAEPVGSKAIVASAGLKVSSATIRNEMAELENLGLLEQPHTSAGRVPSPQGYRLYVNELMEEHRLTMQETQKINEALHTKIRQMDQVMTEAGKIISQLTKYPTFSLTTGTRKAVINRYDLLMVEENSFIAVLMTDTQVVKNKLFRLPTELSDTQLQLLGTLLTHPEYQSLEKAEPLMNYLSEMGDGMNLPVIQGENVRILIGPENVADELKNSSVIMASYDIGGGMQGVIGVVGPTRMDYADLAARLSYFAEGLSRMFGKGEIPPPAGEDPQE